MRAVNLYTFTRNVKSEIKPIYEKALSQRDEELRIREEEFEQMKDLVSNFIYLKAEIKCYEDWFFSFTIPQIGKEFDLLKIGRNDVIVNIELKSQEVPFEQVIKQLIRNKYYLSHIANNIYSFTYMRYADGTAKLFALDGELRESSFVELLERLGEVDNPINNEIETLFRPKDYLISPLNTPDKFIEGKYYLNNQQEEIKKKIIVGIENNHKLWGINGSAGTGKTLLLYDVVKAIAIKYRVCVIHCGILSEGHQFLNTNLKNTTIIDAKSLSLENLEGYEIVCIDETQRLYRTGLEAVLTAYNSGIIKSCIFSYDFAQALSKAEIRRNNPKKLNEIEGFQEERLTERIRTNKEIYSFISNMMRISDRPRSPVDYKNIDILYANNIDESDKLSRTYRRKGYTFITFTPSQYVTNTIDHYSAFVNSHQVIGQEFDNVLIVLDNNFRYSENEELEGHEHPNPDYLFPRLFYQNISRAREKLCIIVLGNELLFEKLLCIKANRL